MREGVVTGISTFVKQQQVVADGSSMLFSTCRQVIGSSNTSDPYFDVAVESKPINKVKPITEKDFEPDDGTPLYDAIARMIDFAATSIYLLEPSRRCYHRHLL